jgi:hypothetical protein
MNKRYVQFFYTPHNKTALIDGSFTVAAGENAGISGLSGSFSNVFMHTSATPSGPANPGTGVILVEFQDTFNKSLGLFAEIVAPVAGSPSASATANTVMVISTVGNATLAQWQAVGLPVGLKPVVGLSFLGTATQAIGGTSRVDTMAATGSAIDHIEVVGNMDKSIASAGPSILGGGSGAYAILQCFNGTTPTAPAAGTVIKLAFLMNGSAQGV